MRFASWAVDAISVKMGIVNQIARPPGYGLPPQRPESALRTHRGKNEN